MKPTGFDSGFISGDPQPFAKSVQVLAHLNRLTSANRRGRHFIEMIRASRFLLVAVLTLSLGLHWAVLQTLAWTGMVITYTQETSSLRVALARTFDGAHPCNLCKFVNEGKKTEQKQEVQKPFKIEMTVAQVSIPLFPPIPRDLSPVSGSALSSRGELPPVPPPRGA